MEETGVTGAAPEMAQPSSTTAAGRQPATEATTQPRARPGRKGKRKTRYTRGLRWDRELERGVVRASQRVSDAVAAGLSTYRKRSNRSDRRRRDGALVDALENWSEAFAETVGKASWAPNDLVARGGNRRRRRRVWRQVRPVVRTVLFPISFFLR